MNYQDLWAKSDPYHPLWCHLLDVAAVCEALLPRFGSVDPIPDTWVMYIAALHDLGKADALFQNKDRDLAAALRVRGLDLPDEAVPFRHEARSAEWLMPHLRDDAGWGRRAAKVVAACVRGHHGDFKAPVYLESDYPLRIAQWTPLRESLSEMVKTILHLEPWDVPRFEDASAVGVKLAGMIVLSDWIASNDEVYRYPTLDKNSGPEHYFQAARQEAAHAIRSLELEELTADRKSGPPLRFCDVWPQCTSLRPSQQTLEDECCSMGVGPGLAIIEAPMGEGKTEAAVYLAEYWTRTVGTSGVYIALPTGATSNQMHGRYARFLEEQHPGGTVPRLVHGMAWLLDEASPTATSITYGEDDENGALAERQRSREWFRPTKRALLASEGVGTVDQALMAALNVKHGFLRLLGLSRKVLIIDEVHAYDEYMTVLMERLLEWCRVLRVPVILLSATLSRAQKKRLAEAYRGAGALPEMFGEAEAYPLLTFVPLDGPGRVAPVQQDPERRRTVALKFHSGVLQDPSGTALLAAAESKDGGCICVLCNTVASAQNVFKALQKLKLQDTDLLLFHARFRAEKRQEIEDRVVSLFGKDAGKDGNPPRPARAILVATQVVEQSLDVDFDIMISQVAPIDLLLQRSGRLHRHQREFRPTGPEPTLHVLMPSEGGFDFGPSEYVYDREILLRTTALLHAHQGFDLPGDFRPLIEQCYGHPEAVFPTIPETDLAGASKSRQEKLNEARKEAHKHLIPSPLKDDFILGDIPEWPVEEGEEGARASYFHAQTRLGDQTRSILVLNHPAAVQMARQPKPPPRERLKELFLQSASIPKWWLSSVVASEDFEPCFYGEGWLRGRLVMPMQEGSWRGLRMGDDGKAKPVTIIDDPELGLLLDKGDETDARV